MFVVASRSAKAAGLRLSDAIENAVRAALEAVRLQVSGNGALGLVSEATPVGQFSTYATRPFGVFPWGQGPLLLMECES